LELIRFGERVALRPFARVPDRAAHPVRGLLPDAAQPLDAAALDRLLEPHDRAHAKLVVPPPLPPSAYLLDRHQLRQRAGDPPSQLLEPPEPPGPDQLRDVAGEILADARQLPQVLARLDHLRQRTAQVADRAGRVPVRADPERVAV